MDDNAITYIVGWPTEPEMVKFRAVAAAAIAEERERCKKACERVGIAMAKTCPIAAKGWWPDQVAYQCMLAILAPDAP